MLRILSTRPLAVSTIAFALVALLAFAPHRASADAVVYRTPPAPVGDILMAPRLPRGAPPVSPDGTHMILGSAPSLIPISALAEPVEKLAGLEILPRLRATRTAIKNAPAGLDIIGLGAASGRPHLPADARVAATAWSNDGKHVACALLAPGGDDLWIVDAWNGQSRQLEGVKLNGALFAQLEWSNDDRAIYCAAVPAGQSPLAEASRVPVGPQYRESAGRAAPQRTARDVLKTADDQQRFAWYLATQLTRVPVDGGAPQPIGSPAMIASWSVAPDEKHLVVERLDANLPLGFPWYLFPGTTEIWNADGSLAAKVGDSPLNDRSAISSVAELGPRDAGFTPDGQAVCFLSWQDTPGANALKAVKDTTLAQPGSDRLMRLAAPFTGAPEVIATANDMQFSGWNPIGATSRVMLYEAYSPRRVQRVEWLDLARPAERHAMVLRSTEGVYDDPGVLQTRRMHHQTVVRTNAAGTIEYLAGAGFRKDGQRPFLDRRDLATGKATRLFECDATHLETVSGLVDDDAKRFITRRESNHEQPNYWLHGPGSKNAKLTGFVDPAPALTASQRISFTFTRSDSVQLHAEAVLPADWKPGKLLPTIFWVYPNDYRSAAAASENRRSPNRFPPQSTLNPEVLVTQGYAVVYPDIAVVGSNDHYVDEIRKSAQAAVDECVRRGFTDRNRVGVGGHSYGAFSSANLLAHTDLFRAGTASDGAYNRTLTPFTFQAEERSLWQAPDTYLRMSPFLAADQIHSPLLLFHNLDDTNVGTNPIQSERMFEALNGMGKTVSLVQYPYEDHIPVSKETVLDYWARAIEWFDRYVKNAAPASAAEVGSVNP